MKKILTLLLLLSAYTLTGVAQSITLLQPFTQVPSATVLNTYGEQFRSWIKPDLDDTFPYALIRVELQGDQNQITMAKQMLGLYMGTQTAVEAIDRSAQNELLFLVPKRARRVEITCGDGCAQLLILESSVGLQSNTIYNGKVLYQPLENMAALNASRQRFQFNVSPKTAVVQVFINGKSEFWPMIDGRASKVLNHGNYTYRITADNYYPEEGAFILSPHSTEIQVKLKPKFGWLNVDGDTQIYGAYVFATNQTTGQTQQLGTLPLQRAELNTGRYALTILLDKFKDYSTTVTINEAQTTNLRPNMLANFSLVTLTTSEMADIYVDGNRVGKGTWNGSLEYGNYLIETRQQGHHTAFTNITIAQGDANVNYTLNNPIPIYGTLIVDGQPIDAKIWIDNQLTTTTPMVFNHMLVGEHRVRISKDGYVDNEQVVTIQEGQDYQLSYSLFRPNDAQLLNNQHAKAEQVHIFNVHNLPLTMVKIPGGTFIMGATTEQREDMNDNEVPIHQVSVSDFYMAQTEITQALWQAIMGNNPSAFPSNPSNPVENVSWQDCQTFISKLNALTGQSFRLPTEAEWEYAARGGQDTINYKYAGDSLAPHVAWIAENSNATTHIVAMKQPNQLGLYDMSGNVCEWCQDWYANYELSSQKDPQGPTSGNYKVYRGGSWYFDARYARVSQRNYHTTTFSNYNIGLRLALTQITQEQTIAPIIEQQPTYELPPINPNNVVSVKGVSFNMIDVKGGDFNMGATSEQANDAMGGEKPVRNITLHDFAIAQTEVTQELWKAVMGNNPSQDSINLHKPVTHVSWNDCQRFITQLNLLTGRQFRLPTEAEWEYAARGGQLSKTYKYAGSANINDVAWYNANSQEHIQPIAQKRPNELGLYDMNGNVCEWCQDWFGTYTGNVLTNPTGPAQGSYRVVRGGSALMPNRMNRVSYRNGYAPNEQQQDLGLRLVEQKDNSATAQKQLHIPTNQNQLRFEVKGVTFNMIKVESASFIMGATAEHQELAYEWEKPMHYVTVSDFFIAQTEVTQELWKAVMDSVPSHFLNDPHNPVESVSWDDCQTFITKLNALTGANFRLPTEAEWEYAARGGKNSQRTIYAGSTNANEVVWSRENSLSSSHPVGLKKANELGLYDMGGNLWEWCQDWYGKYDTASQINPKGPDASNTNRRVIRGGSWAFDMNNCRVTVRSGQAASDRKMDIGFRLAL